MVQRRNGAPQGDRRPDRGPLHRLRTPDPRGFGPPLHSHANEDEFFIVLSGEVRLQHGDEAVDGVPGSLAYTPRGVAHSFRVDSEETRLLLLFGPAGVEAFFREVGTPARWVGPPPADTPVKDREALLEIPPWPDRARPAAGCRGHPCSGQPHVDT